MEEREERLEEKEKEEEPGGLLEAEAVSELEEQWFRTGHMKISRSLLRWRRPAVRALGGVHACSQTMAAAARA
eukprot:2564317-Pyramimonas_sp.AAC.1